MQRNVRGCTEEACRLRREVRARGHPPSIRLSFSRWRGGRHHTELMQALPYTAGCAVLLRDHGVGEVRTSRDGEPILRYRLTSEDVANMRRGIRRRAEIVEAMGAWRIYSSPGEEGGL
jgi:long-chain-alcohol oxidase